MNKDRLLSDEELEKAIDSLFMVGYDLGKTAKIILSAEDLRSHIENNAITERQKVDMAANPHKDKLLHIINTQKRLYAHSIVGEDIKLPKMAFGHDENGNFISGEEIQARVDAVNRKLAEQRARIK